MIDINPQHAAEQIAQILARHPAIRIARSITRRDVEHPIMTENNAAAIVALRVPIENDTLRQRVAPLRLLAVDVKSRDAIGADQIPRHTMKEHVETAVSPIPRMEGDAVNQPVAHLE